MENPEKTFSENRLSPVFSVIIPTLNAEKDIEYCLRSLAEQTFRDFEVLLMDGDSSDNTLKIARSFSDHLKLTILSEKDKGIYDAMNKGIELSKGRWLYFMGSDDELIGNQVLKIVSQYIGFLGEHKHILFGDVVFANTGRKSINHASFNYRHFIDQNINHQGIFFRQDLFKIKGFFSLEYPIFSDWLFNMDCFLDPKIKTEYINTIIALYSNSGVSYNGTDSFSQNRRAHYRRLKRRHNGSFGERLRKKIKSEIRKLFTS